MDVIDRIGKIVDNHCIVLFMRGTPERPMCQGSADAVHALGECGADYHVVDVQADAEVRAFLPKYADWSGCPQLFLQGEWIGGASVISELHVQGELAPMIEQCAPPCAMAS